MLTLFVCRSCLYVDAVWLLTQCGCYAVWLLQVVGSLAEKPLSEGQHLRGLLISSSVGQAGQDRVIAPEDLPLFTTLHTCRVTQRQAIMLNRPFSQVGAWGNT